MYSGGLGHGSRWGMGNERRIDLASRGRLEMFLCTDDGEREYEGNRARSPRGRRTFANWNSTFALLDSWQASLMAFARTPGPQKYVCGDVALATRNGRAPHASHLPQPWS